MAEKEKVKNQGMPHQAAMIMVIELVNLQIQNKLYQTHVLFFKLLVYRTLPLW